MRHCRQARRPRENLPIHHFYHKCRNVRWREHQANRPQSLFLLLVHLFRKLCPTSENSAVKNIRGPVSVVTNRVIPSSLAKPPANVKVTPYSDTDLLSEVSSLHSFSVGLNKMKRPSLFNEPQLNLLIEDSDNNTFKDTGPILIW